MADDILFETADELTVDTLGEAFGRTGISDYVERGLDVTADYQAAVADINAGKAFVLHDGRDLTLLPDARAGLPIGTDGTNHVYISVSESQNSDGSVSLSVDYAVNQSGSAPGGTALKVAEIDMGAQSVTEVNRDAPINDNDATSYKGTDIDSDGDGVVDGADTAAVADAVAGGASDLTYADLIHTGVLDITFPDLLSADVLRATANGTDGLVADPAASNLPATLAPLVDGSAQPGNGIAYNPSADEWSVGGDLVVEGTVSASGQTESVSKEERVRAELESPSFRTPKMYLEPGQEVDFGPYGSGTRHIEVWGWGCRAEDGYTGRDLALELRNGANNPVGAADDPYSQGDLDTMTPIETAHSNVYRLTIENTTGVPRNVSAWAALTFERGADTV